jgi:hypothetical protein
MKAIITNESKEQKSLDKVSNIQTYIVKDVHAKVYEFESVKEYLPKEIAILQALVDKSIPMKVEELKDNVVTLAFDKKYRLKNAQGKCKCGYYPFRGMNYCSKCGQKLDWSDK